MTRLYAGPLRESLVPVSWYSDVYVCYFTDPCPFERGIMGHICQLSFFSDQGRVTVDGLCHCQRSDYGIIFSVFAGMYVSYVCLLQSTFDCHIGGCLSCVATCVVWWNSVSYTVSVLVSIITISIDIKIPLTRAHASVAGIL